MTLITIAYTDVSLWPAKEGFAESISFHYGARWNESHLVNAGGSFGVVHSPSQFVHPSQARWTYTRFTVVMKRPPYGSSKDFERWYRAKSRDLTPEEVAYFEAEWKRLRKE